MINMTIQEILSLPSCGNPDHLTTFHAFDAVFRKCAKQERMADVRFIESTKHAPEGITAHLLAWRDIAQGWQEVVLRVDMGADPIALLRAQPRGEWNLFFKSNLVHVVASPELRSRFVEFALSHGGTSDHPLPDAEAARILMDFGAFAYRDAETGRVQFLESTRVVSLEDKGNDYVAGLWRGADGSFALKPNGPRSGVTAQVAYDFLSACQATHSFEDDGTLSLRDERGVKHGSSGKPDDELLLTALREQLEIALQDTIAHGSR